MNLQHRDWKIIGFLIAAWIIAAFLGGSLDIIQYGMAAELPFDIVTGILGLGAVFYAWQIITHERHKIGRPLTYIGIGTGGFGLTLAPHIWMHMNMPQLFGFFGWSHTVTLWSFLLITYGYYLLTEVRGGTFDRRDWLVVTGSFLISIVAGGVASGRSAAFALR
ncbi:MAG: hypothetical protein SVU32_00060, partial [Candidatus Nanohaloarchaea archaeon]|nr:hypothetical protein [Candidatus Nanohaloarchaea archaeon]